LSKLHETDSIGDSIELNNILDTITAAGVRLLGNPRPPATVALADRTAPAGFDQTVRAGSFSMSFLLTCPNCGIREVTDFGYGGEISPRPTTRPTLRELGEYNYFRRNRAGVQREWWFHRSGCRAWFIAERDTTTNEVLLTELPRDPNGGNLA
jgi:heterotetrameric sarcosine oxidase delta subunit